MLAPTRPSKVLVAHVLIATLFVGLVPPAPRAYAGSPSSPEWVPLPPDAPASVIRNALGNSSPSSLGRVGQRPVAAKALGPTPAATDPRRTADPPGVSLLRPEGAPAPVPGIQRTPLAKEGMLYQEVEPPRSPFDVVKHFPNEYLPPGVALQPPGAVPELRVRPSELRFAQTPAGIVPASQTLELTADSRPGVGFEVAELPDWLQVSYRRGKASYERTAVEVSVLERRVEGAVEGEVVVRNLDDPADVRRVPVRLSVVEDGEPIEPLRSYDEDGRLQRVVRADGRIIDYEYDDYGQLTRIRYPDGTSVGYTYDDAGRRTSMADGQGTTVYRYDEKGRLAAVYQPGFNPVRYKWDDEDRLVALTYPHGKVVSYGYDDEGRLASVLEDAGTTTYRYNEEGRLLGQTLPNGISTEYGYDRDGRIVEVLHENAEGELLLGFRYELDERGLTTQMERKTPAGVEVTSYGYDGAGRVVRADYPSGSSVSYEYDEFGTRLMMTETEGADVTVTDYYYDVEGRLLQAGNETFEYDIHGNVAARHSPGRTLKYGYDSENRLVSFEDGKHEVFYEYDGDGQRVLASVDGHATRHGFDATGVIGDVLFDAHIDRRIGRAYGYGLERHSQSSTEGETELFLYDRPLRNVAGIGALSGEVAELYVYDVFGEPERIPDDTSFLFGASPYDPATGLIVFRGHYYDPTVDTFLTGGKNSSASVYFNHPPKSHQPSSGTLSDRLAQAIGSNEISTSADRSTSQNSPTEVAIFQSNQLPTTQRPAKQRRAPLPFPKLVQFDRGRVYRRPIIHKSSPLPRLDVHPEYLQFARTAAGLLISSQTLEVGSTTGETLPFTLSEDIPWLEMTATAGTAGIAPAVVTVTVNETGLDSALSPYTGTITATNSSDPDDVRQVHVRLTIVDSHATPTLQSFDAQGNSQRLIKPDGTVIDHFYNSLGRKVRVRDSTGLEVAYTYDANGNRITMVDHRGTTFYQYDSKNRLTAIFNPGLNPIRYEYGKTGKLITVTYPDGRRIENEYDADGRLHRVIHGSEVTTYEYDTPSGFLLRQTLPNGIATSYTHDAGGRLTDVEHRAGDGSLLRAFRYTLDADGMRTAVTEETASESRSSSYTYDALGRISGVIHPDGRAVSYGYDAVGNRLSRVDSINGSTAYTYDDDNHLVAAGDISFQYDANGNVIRRISPEKVVEYTYDSRNLLIRVEDGTQVVEFEYDGDGHRVAKTANGVRRNYINKGGGVSQVLIEADADWQVQRSYVYGLDRFGVEQEGEHRYFLYDSPQKSVFALADAAGLLTQEMAYDAFGQPLTSVDEQTVPFLFNGERYDYETGLVFLRSRYYDPDLGRFLSRDAFIGTLISPDSLNPFVFAGNDPINFIDVSGLKRLLVGGVGSCQAVYDANYDTNYDQIVALGTGSQVVDLLYAAWDTTAGDILGRIFNTDNFYSPPAQNAIDQISQGGRYTEIHSHSWGTIPVNFCISSGACQADTSIYFGSPLAWGGLNLRPWDRSIANAGDLVTYTGLLFRSPLFNLNSTPEVTFEFGNGGLFGPHSLTESYLQPGGFLGNSFSNNQSSFLGSDLLFSQSNFNSLSNPWGLSQLGGVGGVALNKTADLLLQIDDIAGATFDPATGQIILFGEEDLSLPAMDLDDLAVAVNSVFTGEDPGVSIDPPIQNGQMSVRYEGETIGTMFGWVMFEADRVLKILSLGKDNLTGQPVSSNVVGYKDMLTRRRETGCAGLPDSTRMWFQPKEMRLVRSADGQTMVFDQVSMELLYESKSGDQVVSDPQAAAFAQHFTENYDLFAQEWPILRELERLGKIVSVMKWIKDNNIPLDLSFIANYDIEFFSTPVSTPVVSVHGNSGTCQITLTGGVTYRPPNEYLSDDPVDPVTDGIRDEALAQRPSETDFLWTFQTSAATHERLDSKVAAGGPLTAVAQSFTRSRKSGDTRFREIDLTYPAAGAFRLELARHYDSFGDRPSPLGRGWSVLPYELRFPVAKETFTFGNDNLALELHARIWLSSRQENQEDIYELVGIDSGDLPLYARAGSMDLLRQLADSTFLLTRTDGRRFTFDASGRPQTAADSNGQGLAFAYDEANGHLTRIETAGRAITLTRDASHRIVQADGPGGRQLTYGYNAEGLLHTVTEGTEQVRTYTYDGDGRLVRAIDGGENLILDTGYDDYNRTPSRQLRTAASFAMDFDLETRKVRVTDPSGQVIEQSFDEQYRPVDRLDPAGNRFEVAYDGAFGPMRITDTSGAATEFAYDVRGNLTTMIDPAGGSTELFYDALDRLIAVRDPEGIELAFGYDEFNNLSIVYHAVQLVQDQAGNLTSFFFDPDNVTSVTYDAAGMPRTVKDPLDQESLLVFDANGQLTSVSTPSSRVTDFSYDAKSRLTAIDTGGYQIGLGFDEGDHLTSVATAGGVSVLEYDAAGRLIGVADAQGDQTNFEYDADDNLTAVEDATLGVTRYSYDALGGLNAIELPNGTRYDYEFDAMGRPAVAWSGLGNPTPRLGLASTSLDFSSVALGTQATLELDLYNLAPVPLTISGVTTSPPFSTDFTAPVEIAPGDFLTVDVTFTPSAVGPAAGELTVTSDDPDDPVRLVDLDGVGTIKIVNLRATPASDGIQLDWDPFDPGAQTFLHFNVYRSTSPIPGDVGGLVPIDESLTDAAETGFRDRSAAPGVSYFYAVTPEFTGFEPTAVDAVGPVAFFTSFDVLGPTSGLATSADDETRPAVAYDSAADDYLLVYEKDTSGAGTNFDVYGQRVGADGSLIGAPFAIAAKALTERRPRLAYNSTANNYLVVFEEDFNGDGSNFVVYGQRVSATGSLVGSAFFVGGFIFDETNPELAYNFAGNDFLVVFEMDADDDDKLDCVGQRISAAGSKLGDPFFVGGISVDGVPVVDQNPHLTYNAADNEYLVAYEVDVEDDGSDFEILGVRFSGDGAYLSGPFLLGSTVHAVTGAALQDRNPYVGHDSSHNEYLTLWDVDVNGDGSNWSIASQKTDVLGSPISLLDGFLVVVDTTAQERNARQVYNATADEHLLVWDEASAGGDPRIQARRYRLTSSSLLWGGVLEVAGGAADLRSRPDGAFNGASNEMLVVWESDTGTGLDVESRRLGNVAPVLEVSPSSLDFGAATVNLGLTVSNTGTGALDWVANSGQPWLAASPPSGSTTESEVLTVSVDRSGLSPGSFNATLTVASSGGNVDVPVTMTVPNTPPDAPHGPSPAAGASGLRAPDGSLDLTLGWQSGDADGDAVTYDLYFSTNAALVTAEDPSVRHRQGLGTASTQLSGLAFLTSYFWRVVAFDSRGDSTSGPTWSFTTAAVAAPQLFEVSPDPTNLPRPVLAWQAVTGASGYHLQVDDDPSFATPLIDQSGLAATSFTPAADLPEGQLHWRVRSLDGTGQPGSFSAVDSFTADRTAPSTPALVPLTPDPTRDARPELRWNGASGASAYQLQVASDGSFSALLVDLTSSAMSHEPASGLPEGQIHWRVASRDAAGNQSAFSAADVFEIDLTSPPAVTGLTAERSGNDAVLTWSPLAGPPADFDHFNFYRSQFAFANVSGMTPLSSWLSDGTAVTFTDTTATPGTGFFYAVTAVDGVGNENKTVTTALLPGNLSPLPPSDPAPADGASGLVGPDVALTWQASDPDSPALTFDVYLSQVRSQVEGLDITTRAAQDLTSPSFLAAGRAFGTTYFWRAVAFDDQGASTPGPVWSFTTGGMAAPVLAALTPDPTNDPRPTFNWLAVAGAATYQVQIDDNADFGSPIVDDATSTGTAFTPSSDLPEGTLHWRVRGISGLGQTGLFAAADSFVSDRTPPAVPVLTPVSPNPTPLRRPELSWTATAQTVGYRLQISTDPAFGTTVVDVTVPSASFRPASDLSDGLHYWRVSSRDVAGNESAFSPADAFTVDFGLSEPIFLDGFESGDVSSWSASTQ